jgi:hypothetical protein
MPLDNVWALVHANDYWGAVELFEQIRDAEHHYVGPTPDGA